MVAAGRPETTVRLRCYQLGRVRDDLGDLWAASTDDLAEWIAGHRWAPETMRSWRAALTGFYRWGITTGRATSNPAAELPVVRVPRRVARPTPEDAITAALAGADQRLWLMISLAARCGLRRGEIAQVAGPHLLEDEQGPALAVRGKGGRERIVPVPRDVADRIRDLGRRHDGGWAFPGQIDGHLSARRVGELVAEALPGAWTCHTLRHRFGTRSYGASHDLGAVQELLGHSKPETTRIYVAIPPAALRAATAWAA
jgi:integrase